MNAEPILVVMAAGMGSRYGGLKQIDPVGSHGEAILDYSLFDAAAAGFKTAVIIIKEAIREDFMATVGKRLEACPMEIIYAYQEITKIPTGYSVPEGREKPWGTGHAILCCKDVLDGPFAVINADDFYGPTAFSAIYDYLANNEDESRYAMIGYRVRNTVTENGSVARGVC
jgi:choline kinase